MPLVKFAFQPGINKDDTPLEAEGGYVDADKVRFVRGKPQTVGGWSAATSSTFTGVARGGHSWVNLNGTKYAAWGTADKLYCLIGGGIVDITPPHSEGVLTDPFAMSNGSPTVVVTHADHGLVSGNSITFTHAEAVGGLTINGAYTVADVLDANSYQITASGNASSTATGGGKVDYTAPLPAGLIDGLGGSGTGYGVGDYGEGTYGGSSATSGLPRIWSLDNWGERLVAVPRGGGLYEYQPRETYPEIVKNGGFLSSANWILGSGWTIGAGVASKSVLSASNLAQNTTGIIGGSVYRVTFDVVRNNGSVTFKLFAGTEVFVGDASEPISVSGTYSRLFWAPPNTTQILFAASGTFNGSIDNVSIKIENKAYRIDEAPRRSEAMFVTPERFIVLMGTVEEDGDYNQLAVRHCDQENNRVWTTTTTNLAAEYILASGGRCVGGLVARRQSLVWTDNALYVMQYVGSTDEVYSFDLIGTGCGAIGRNAVGEHSGVVFWWGRNNFYLFNGSAAQPIICPLKQDVFDNLAPAQEEKVFCGINPGYTEAWFFYPDARDGKECSRYAAFNWADNTWVTGTFNRSTWIKPGIFPEPIGLGTDGMVYFHETGQSANGGVISAFLETAFFDIEDGTNLVHINRIVPDFEEQQGGVSFFLKYRQWPNGTEYEKGPFVANPTTQKLDMRATARQVKVRFESGSSPSFWRLGAIRFDIKPTGKKR